MRRQFIWMQAALCAVTFSVAAPVLARADAGQPPPHAQAHGKDKAKKAKPQKGQPRQGQRPTTGTTASAGWIATATAS